MSDKSWKAFEREVAGLCGGARGWANSGERYDVAVPDFGAAEVLIQCKLVRKMSTAELARLVFTHRGETDETNGTTTVVAVATRVPRSRRTIVAMTMGDFARLLAARRLLKKRLDCQHDWNYHVEPLACRRCGVLLESKATVDPPVPPSSAKHS